MKKTIIHLIVTIFLLLLKPLAIAKEYSISFIIISNVIETVIIIYQYIAIPKIVVNNEKRNYLPNIWLIIAIIPIVSISTGSYIYVMMNIYKNFENSFIISFIILFSSTEIFITVYINKIIKKIKYLSTYNKRT